MAEPNPHRTRSHAPANQGPSDSTVDRANTDDGAAARPAPPAVAIPGYDLLHELGKGGMGVVYLARQKALNREVALKTIRRADADGAAVARFWAEAQIMAAVKHPHVVQVFEMGEHDGQPFIAMELVPGGSLAAHLRAEGRVLAREGAELVRKVARGVAAAHDLGVIHRDLKPANVLLAADGEPKVTDFGLAKWQSAGLTRTQAVMGTPAYMAPEQAAGGAKFLGPPADVWALGVILYECVAGERPFAGDVGGSLLHQIQSAEPPSLGSRVRSVPRDLETIVAKCLSKNPAHRYATAGELADDLGRFTRGEPIVARPVGRTERLVRWARRKPTAAAAYGLSALAAVLALAVFVVLGFWREAVSARGQVEGLLGTEQRLSGELQTANDRLEGALDGERKAKRTAEEARDGQAALKREAAYQSYASTVDLALREYQVNNTVRARELLAACPPDLRGWEWHYVRNLCNTAGVVFAHGRGPGPAEFSPDGSKVLTGGFEGNGPAVVLRVCDAATGKELAALRGHVQGARASFTADGKHVISASGDETARLWDAATGRELVVFRGHGVGATVDPGLAALGARAGSVATAAVSRTGGRVVTASGDKTARLWDAKTGKELIVFRGHTAGVQLAAFLPNGNVLTSSYDGTARVWSATGRELVVLKTGGWGSGVTFSRDGQFLACPSPGGVRLWDARSGAELAPLNHGVPLPADASTRTARFSYGSDRVVAACADKVARVWDVKTGKVVAVLSGHTGQVTDAAFARDGRVVTASVDMTARVWDVDKGQVLAVLSGHTKGVSSASFSPDGKRVVTRSEDGTARVWTLATPHPPLFGEVNASIHTARFSDDGRRAVGLGFRPNSVVFVWDMKGDKEFVPFGLPDEYPALWAYPSADGRRVVTFSQDDRLCVWDGDTGKTTATLRGHKGLVWTAAFSADGTRVVSAGTDGTARVWDAASGKLLATINASAHSLRSVSFSPDGRLIATGGGVGAAHVWDWATGKQVGALKGHTGDVTAVKFLPSGTRVLTSANDTTARVWDVETGRELAVMRGHSQPITSLSLSPDGKRAVTSSRDFTHRVWDTTTGRQMLILSWSGREVYLEEPVASFTSDGARILMAVQRIGPTFRSCEMIVYDGTPIDEK